jgi:NADP-dependent 3-hydroxy acid dehydrogenase YdfG
LQRIAVITGGSSGIGAATAHALTRLGQRVVIGARGIRPGETWDENGSIAVPLDVRIEASVEAFAARIASLTDHVDVLVNAAGLALGREPIGEASDTDWQTMFDTNVMGLMRTTQALLPLLRSGGAGGHIVNIGSMAGFDCYPGGGGYSASKHAVRAITKTLRLELNGEPIRVTEIDPGITRTRFAEVRFKGDRSREEAVYEGLTPLSAEDVAECVVFAVTRPPHVDVDWIVVRPLAQATSYRITRRPSEAGAGG